MLTIVKITINKIKAIEIFLPTFASACCLYLYPMMIEMINNTNEITPVRKDIFNASSICSPIDFPKTKVNETKIAKIEKIKGSVPIPACSSGLKLITSNPYELSSYA